MLDVKPRINLMMAPTLSTASVVGAGLAPNPHNRVDGNPRTQTRRKKNRRIDEARIRRLVNSNTAEINEWNREVDRKKAERKSKARANQAAAAEALRATAVKSL